MQKKIKIAVCCLLILAVLASGFYLYFTLTKKTVTDQPDDSKTAAINDLGISFRYPALWGDVLIENGRVETGIDKYVNFSIIKTGIPIISYASKDFTAGRSGTTAEIWTIRQWSDAQTCSEINQRLSLVSNSGDCQEYTTKNGKKIFLFKMTKFGSESAEALYFTGHPQFSVLGMEFGPASEENMELLRVMMTSIDNLK